MKLASLLAILGAAITAAAAYVYVTPSLSLPFFDDGDGPKLIVAGLGVGWVLVGTVQAYRLGRGWLMKVFLALVLLATLLAASGLAFHALSFARMLPPPAKFAPGESAPVFSLPDQDGKTVTLADFRGKRLVLGFYRGGWCPWCAIQLKVVQGKLEDIRAAGGEVAFVSSDSCADSKALAEKLGLKFTLLSDPKLERIEAYGLAHRQDLQLKKLEAARPAVLFINTDGTFATSWQPDDLRRFMSEDDLMAAFSLTK